MLTLTIRDLRYRWRQFAIAVVGAALVFGLTLLLTGMTAGFDAEARSTVASAGADRWIVPAGVAGPFTSQAPVQASLAGDVRGTPGVERAGTFVQFGFVAELPDGSREMVNVVGQDADGLPDPAIVPEPGHAIVGERLGVDRGDVLRLGRVRVRVQGEREASYYAGVPVVRLRLADAHAVGGSGRDAVSAVLVRGVSGRVPAGYDVLDADAVRADVLRPVESAKATIAAVRALMWAVAALIIGAVTYLSALDRVRDFAVLKAVGAGSRTLAGSLVVQAVLAAVLAAALAVVLSRLMAPAMTLPIAFEWGAVALLVVVALVVGVLSSLVALMRAVRVDPALAFAG